MSNFIYDIQLGFLAFPLVALLLAVPYALYQYRRFGAISIWKTFVVFTFILYFLCAVSLIVFPLPADHSAVVESARTPQLHPFHVIDQIRETTDFSLSDRSTWGPALRSPVVYEAIFNVMLTVPLGAYLCYLFRCRWWMALLIGMATTRNIAADWFVRTLRAPLPPLRRGRPDLEHHGHNAGILAHDPPCLGAAKHGRGERTSSRTRQ